MPVRIKHRLPHKQKEIIILWSMLLVHMTTRNHGGSLTYIFLLIAFLALKKSNNDLNKWSFQGLNFLGD